MSSIRSILEETCRHINWEVQFSDDYINTVVDQALKEIEKAMDVVKPNIKDHICRFNDGNCVCECYKAGQDEYQSNLKELLK